jgi:hypothetical protein
MERRRQLVAVSTAQLAVQAAGLAVALRRRHPYEALWMHGRPDAILRDSVLMGTALSAPMPMLVTHAAMTVVVAGRPSRPAAWTLRALGAANVGGYLAERLVRRRLRPSGWDALESPLAAVGIGLAAGMAACAAEP